MEGGFLNSPRAKCSKGFPLAFLSIQAQDWTTDINRFNRPRGSVYKSHAHLTCRVFSSCMHCQFIRLYRIVYGGRTFLRRIIDQICLLKSPRAKYKLSVEFFADLHWWISFLRIFNGKCAFLNNVPTADVQTDACNFGAGGFFQGDWYYHSFVCDKPEVANLHINFNEVLAIYFAAKHWAPS